MPDAVGFAMATGILVAVLAIFGVVSRLVAGLATELRCSFGAGVAFGLQAWSRDPDPGDGARERTADAAGDDSRAGGDTGPGGDGGHGGDGGPGEPAARVPVTHVAGPGLLPWHSALGRGQAVVPVLA